MLHDILYFISRPICYLFDWIEYLKEQKAYQEILEEREKKK
jgi:hypothetical protein